MIQKPINEKTSRRISFWSIMIFVFCLFAFVWLAVQNMAAISPQEDAYIEEVVAEQLTATPRTLVQKAPLIALQAPQDANLELWQEVCRIQKEIDIEPAERCAAIARKMCADCD